MKRIITIFMTICILFSSVITINAMEITHTEMETISNEDGQENELMPLTANDECEDDEDDDDDDEIVVPIGGGISISLPNIASGWTTHAAQQAAGRDGGRGVANFAIYDAYYNPVEVAPGSNNSTQYIGKYAVVCVGNESNKITTCWPLTSDAYR